MTRGRRRERDEPAAGAPDEEPVSEDLDVDDVIDEDDELWDEADDDEPDGDDEPDEPDVDEDEDATRGPGARPARTDPAPLEASEQIALAARLGLLVALPAAFWIAGSLAVAIIAFVVLAGVMAGTLTPDGPTPTR